MKNVEKSLIIVLILIFLGVLIGVIYLSRIAINEEQEIYGIINNKAYSLKEIKKEYGKDFIKKITDDKVVVFNGETNYDCEYNKACDIWPNSKSGMITWTAPLVTVTFKQGDISDFKKDKLTNNIELQIIKCDVATNIETIEKSVDVVLNNEINLEEYNGNNIEILEINDENVKILRSALKYEKFDSGRVLKYLLPVEEYIDYDNNFPININDIAPGSPASQARYSYILKFVKKN